jgi:hypothetical protein
MVTDRTLALHSFGVSDGALFENDLGVFIQANAPAIKDSLLWLEKKTGVDVAALYKNINDEVGLCFLESFKSKKISKVLIIESKNPSVILNSFGRISEKLSIDTVFFERYGDYEINEVPVFRFPEKLFWPLVTGFNQSFYTSSGNFIFIADDVDELKKFLNDIDEDDTWGKSVSYNKFLETTLLESNISIYINTPKVWNLLALNLQPKWKQFVKENQPLLQSLQLGAIQFSHLNNSYYTNVSLNYKPLAGAQNTGNKKTERFVTNFNAGILGVYTVKSHVSRGNELLVQDSINDLSLVSGEGNFLWKIPIGDHITSDVSQVDFYGNGKLQYFFSTRNALHVIDRLGNYVEPYPIFLSGGDIQHASVIDYDHSKKYRFLVADAAGKLRMYDKTGNNLEGWNPKDIGGVLAMPPSHHRIKGKDYVIAIRKDGTVHLMNRRGEDLRNFPLKLDAQLEGDYFLEKGNTIADTYFVVVSNDGYRIKFTIDGKIQSKETLLKTSVNSQFGLISEESNRSYLIRQQDSRQFNLTDEGGKKFILNDFVGANKVHVSYHDFGSGKVYVSITDLAQGHSYIYDGSGNLLTSPPVESSFLEIGILNSDEIRLFIVHDRSLTIEPL